MKSVYEKHRAAFGTVEAHAILRDGRHVANIAIKFPKAGSMRVHAFVHWIGLEPVHGFAGGGGYDKRGAAISAAAGKLPHSMGRDEALDAFWVALASYGGHSWDYHLRAKGFNPVQAI
jgi:hypothetical protein